jgi:hypothetical protein
MFEEGKSWSIVLPKFWRCQHGGHEGGRGRGETADARKRPHYRRVHFLAANRNNGEGAVCDRGGAAGGTAVLGRAFLGRTFGVGDRRWTATSAPGTARGRMVGTFRDGRRRLQRPGQANPGRRPVFSAFRRHLPRFGPRKGRPLLNDEELQVFLGCTTHSFGQLSDEWKAWAKAVILSAKVDARGKGTIQRNDAVLYLCQIIRVVEGFQKRITEDSLRGTFVSGLVACGFPPDTDASFSFLRAMGDVQTRGFVAYEDVGWGSEEERLFRLTLAGQRLADNAAIPEPSEIVQAAPDKTAKSRTDLDVIALWQEAQRVLEVLERLADAIGVGRPRRTPYTYSGTCETVPGKEEWHPGVTATTRELLSLMEGMEPKNREHRLFSFVWEYVRHLTVQLAEDTFDYGSGDSQEPCVPDVLAKVRAAICELKSEITELEGHPELKEWRYEQSRRMLLGLKITEESDKQAGGWAKTPERTCDHPSNEPLALTQDEVPPIDTRDDVPAFRKVPASADIAAIAERLEAVQPMPSETAESRTDRPDYVSLWQDASEVLNLAQELRSVVSELDQWENDEGLWGRATGIPNFREVTIAEITAAAQVIETLRKKPQFADTGDCLFPGTRDDTVDNVNIAIHAVFSFAEGITTRIGLDRFDADGYPIRNDCNRCYILVKNLKEQLGKLEALPEVTSHMARMARDKLRQRMGDSLGLQENTPAASSSVASDVNTAPDTVATPAASKPTNRDSKDTCPIGEFDPPLSHVDLAIRYGRDPEATRKMLDRWRKRNGDGWHEVDNRKQNEPKYLYRLSAVRTLFEERPSGNVSGDRPAE